MQRAVNAKGGLDNGVVELEWCLWTRAREQGRGEKGEERRPEELVFIILYYCLKTRQNYLLMGKKDVQ